MLAGMKLSRRETLALAAGAAAAQPPPGRAPELCLLTAVEMSRRLRSRDLSARDLLEAHLRQIERVNPKVNAIVTMVADQARAQAKLADEAAARGKFLGPLHGLPIAHKDLVDTRGIRTTYGSPIFKDHVPAQDALLITRIRRAGAVTLGKTNTPEFGAGSQTFNPVFGATRNPYDLSKTCGGSSGGAAVALACGMLPIADGSDMGGSLRNPAAFCSVVGFRTSPGRVPRVPSTSSWNTLSVLGPMARTVADATLLLSAIAGPDPRSPLSIHDPGARFAQPLGRDFKGVRVAWLPNFAGLPFDRRVRAVFNSRRKAFASLGCIVEEPELDFSDADQAFKVFRALEFYHQHAPKLAKHRPLLKPTVIQEIERGARITAAEIADAEARRSRLFARVGRFMEKYEFFVLPVTQVPPFDVNQQYVTEIDGTKMANYTDWMRSCYYVSVIGHPAISVPGGLTPEGLPVGIQIVGRHQDDWGVLQMAAAYEQAVGLPNPPPVAYPTENA
jgi:amidase